MIGYWTGMQHDDKPIPVCRVKEHADVRLDCILGTVRSTEFPIFDRGTGSTFDKPVFDSSRLMKKYNSKIIRSKAKEHYYGP